MFKAVGRKRLTVGLGFLLIFSSVICGRYFKPTVKAAPPGLTNSDASQEARNVYNYLCNLSGRGILAGQQESTWVNHNPDDELEYIWDNTGKLPTIRGLDYLDEDFDGVTARAIAWWDKGGIPSICWHWGAPTRGVGYEASRQTIDVAAALTPGTKLNRVMLAELDRVAEELKRLRDAKVPVLWRPFHEFDGGWFWWGKDGSAAFKKLWILMYDRYTKFHQLNNLIWVLGFSGALKPGWYPGDAYVDIAGADTYGDDGSQISLYNSLTRIVGRVRPVCYHECGMIPDPDKLIADGAKWVWFLTWHTSFVKEQNSVSHLKKVYQHQYVITLDELPDFRSGSGKR
jgi:hypothetical protein